MKPDPYIKRSAQQSEQSERNSIEGGDQDKRRPSGDTQRRNRKMPFGGLPRPCRGIQNMLPAYLDESLNAGERQTVGRHLDVCAACRHELRLLARSEQALIGAACAVPLPGDLRAGFYARLAMTPRPADKRRAFVPALAVCGLLLLASTTAYRLYVASGGSTVQKLLVSSDTRSIAAIHPGGLPEILPMGRALRPASAFAYQGDRRKSMPVTRKTPSVGGGSHQALASLFTGRQGKLTLGSGRRHTAWEPQRIAAAPRASLSKPLIAAAAPKRIPGLHLPGQHDIQVAWLTKQERAAAWPQTRRDVRLTREETLPTTNGFGLQTDALDANAALLAKEQHNGPAFDYETKLQMSPSTTSAGAVERENMANTRDSAAMGYDVSEMDGVSFQVKDARRGFVSGTRSDSRMQVRDGRQVLSVHLEDQDRSDADTTDKPVSARSTTQPAQPAKTGPEKAGSEKAGLEKER